MHASPESLVQLYLALFHKNKVSGTPVGNGRPHRHRSKSKAAFVPPIIAASPKRTRQSKVQVKALKDSLGWAATGAAFVVMTAFNPPAAEAADVTRGAELFKANCNGCHLGGANFIKEKKTLQKEALEQYQSLDQEKLQAFVQTKMPHSMLPFHSEFSDDNYRDVVSYVLDQSIGEKWQ